MATLVLGASGATGKEVVEHLLKMDKEVKVLVRPNSTFPDAWTNLENVSILKANITELNEKEMLGYLKDCQSVVSCLGHNATLKGIWGKPRKFVTEAVKLVCNSIIKSKPKQPVKLVLMNTAGNINKDLSEPVSVAHKVVLGLIRILVPPHVDNEKAADYLRVNIGQKNEFIEWVAVRPDTLLDEEQVSEYELHPSPTTSALFNPSKTSRINVGHYMASLIVNNELWERWKGQMPVIYNLRS